MLSKICYFLVFFVILYENKYTKLSVHSTLFSWFSCLFNFVIILLSPLYIIFLEFNLCSLFIRIGVHDVFNIEQRDDLLRIFYLICYFYAVVVVLCFFYSFSLSLYFGNLSNTNSLRKQRTCSLAVACSQFNGMQQNWCVINTTPPQVIIPYSV